MSTFICDSKKVGIFYLWLTFFGGLFGISFSFYMRLELCSPFCVLLDDLYFVFLTSHGFIMLFFFVTVFSSLFLNFLLPDFCFLEDMFLKKVNLFSFYLFLISLFFLFVSLFLGEGVSTGWTVYVPLSYSLYSSSCSLDLAISSIHFFSLGSVLSSINTLLTIFFILFRFESFFDFSPFVIGYFFTSWLVILAVPSLTAVLTMLLGDRNFNTFFFDFEFGGDPVLFQVIFWIFGHPEVYILILPVFSLVSLVIENICVGGLFNRIGIIFSMFSLFLLSFIVFGHHMVTVGYSLDFRGFFMTSTIAISVPTGVKIFSWVFSLFLYGKRFNLSVGFLIIFLFVFSFGGLSGVFLSNTSLDLVFHDTYFVVAHFHIVLSVASVFGFLSGFFYFFESFFLRYFYFDLKFYFFFIFIFLIILLFFPFHFLGFLGLPRRITCYSFEFYSFMYFISFVFLSFFIFLFLFFFVVLLFLFLKLE